ncbi:hypothetical protein [Paenibacillus sp. JNUCC31]|uniref:hypothetical protein n=1 Tax=Paenibacillus sp. JNUCC-31 TaxID=2777983 RepID=UPI001E37DFB4|nr:hypothetical protein [Paenibacillus sp. JNUCC-31]
MKRTREMVVRRHAYICEKVQRVWTVGQSGMRPLLAPSGTGWTVHGMYNRNLFT